MRNARGRLTVPVTATSRQAAARHLEAARVLAGRPSRRSLATATGMGYGHLLRVANAEEPLTSTDLRDLAAVLGVPSEWPRDGWTSARAAS